MEGITPHLRREDCMRSNGFKWGDLIFYFKFWISFQLSVESWCWLLICPEIWANLCSNLSTEILSAQLEHLGKYWFREARSIARFAHIISQVMFSSFPSFSSNLPLLCFSVKEYQENIKLEDTQIDAENRAICVLKLCSIKYPHT